MPPRAPSALLAYPRADQRGGESVGLNRLGGTDRLCETLSSWRLLVAGLSPGASHHSFTTSSEEPPLSNFNSYRDIPQEHPEQALACASLLMGRASLTNFWSSVIAATWSFSAELVFRCQRVCRIS